MLTAFIPIRVIDIIDILLVAFLLYQVYYLIKGTVAYSIFMGIIVVWLVFWVVTLLKMKLLSAILGTAIGGGAIALIIVFQQEIRRFLVVFGSKYFPDKNFSFRNVIGKRSKENEKLKIASIQKACATLMKTATGALIVITKSSSLELYTETGDILNANISSRLLESIFNKNSPLHDGAVIIENNLIRAARCVLPFTNNTELPPYYGMRHRAGLGISENSDAFVIIISEERGEISIAENGELIANLGEDELWHLLKRKFNEI